MNVYDEILAIKNMLMNFMQKEDERHRLINERLQDISDRPKKLEKVVGGLKEALKENAKDLIMRLEQID